MKKKVIVILFLLLIGLAAFSVYSCHHKERIRSPIVKQNSGSKKMSLPQSSSLPISKEAQAEAKETLEQATSPLGETEKNLVKPSLELAFVELAKINDQSMVQVTYDNHLSITSLAMAQTMVTLLQAGYQLDIASLEVYQSYNDNVYQFIVNLVKEGASDLSLAGNYVLGTQQIEIANVHGTPTGVIH